MFPVFRGEPAKRGLFVFSTKLRKELVDLAADRSLEYTWMMVDYYAIFGISPGKASKNSVIKNPFLSFICMNNKNRNKIIAKLCLILALVILPMDM